MLRRPSPSGGDGADASTDTASNHHVPPASKSTGQILAELWELLRTYAQQQTVDPLKALGRYLKFGVPGALLIGTGIVFLSLAALRALQTETEITELDWWIFNDLSFLPYLIVASVLVVLLALWVRRLVRVAGAAAADPELAEHLR